MTLQKIESDFSVCQISTTQGLDFSRDFVFLSKTDDELSLVCETAFVPSDFIVNHEAGWQALKIVGILDFTLVGVIAKISDILARDKIGLFVISTYNTDYILVKKTNMNRTVQLLEKEGYEVISR